jgi:hypothetical protein
VISRIAITPRSNPRRGPRHRPVRARSSPVTRRTSGIPLGRGRLLRPQPGGSEVVRDQPPHDGGPPWYVAGNALPRHSSPQQREPDPTDQSQGVRSACQGPWSRGRSTVGTGRRGTTQLLACPLAGRAIDQHARIAGRTREWLDALRDASYLLRGADLRDAETWLAQQGDGVKHQPRQWKPSPETDLSSITRASTPERLAARYNFLHFAQGRPCGLPPAALRPGNDTPVTREPASPFHHLME